MIERSLGEPPFGALRLPASLEYLRAVANRLEDGSLSRRLMSVARHVCLSIRPDPIDVDVFHGARARLYPRSNRCEKRVFLGVKSWDAKERAAITAGMMTAPAGRPFIFVDGGANVGLYSLFVAGEARRLGREARILAIEPDPQNLSRLRFNIAASGASEISVAPVALGAKAGESLLLSEQSNRGEVRLAAAGEEASPGTRVAVRPLHAVLEDADIPYSDILKLDIEGAELPTLSALFAEAPRTLWPRMIILEIGKGQAPTEAMALCVKAGYSLQERARLNAILHLDAQARPAGPASGGR